MLGRGLTVAALVAVAACTGGGAPTATPTTTPATVRLGGGQAPDEQLTDVETPGEVSTVAVLDGRLFAVGGQLVDGPGRRYAHDVRELDPGTGEVLGLVEVDGAERIDAGHGLLWVAGDRLAILTPDLGVVASLDLRPSDVAFDATHAWVADGDRLVRVTPAAMVDDEVALPGEAKAVVVTGGEVWAHVGDRLLRVADGAVAEDAPWQGPVLLAGEHGGVWTEVDDVLQEADPRRRRLPWAHHRGVDVWAMAPTADGFVVGGATHVARIADGRVRRHAHGKAEVWSVAVAGDVAWAATLGGRLLRLGPPLPALRPEPAFQVDPPTVPAGAVVTLRGRNLEPAGGARPLRLVSTGTKYVKLGEASVRPSGTLAAGLVVSAPPGRYHVAFDLRRTGEVEVVPARVGESHRVVVTNGCLRFDGRTWPAPVDAADGTFTLTAPDTGDLRWGGGTAALAAAPCH